MFAVDPGVGARKLQAWGQPGDADQVTDQPADGDRPTNADQSINADQPTSDDTDRLRRRSRWAPALRWVGPLLLLVEIALVTTGLLDWRLAAGIFA